MSKPNETTINWREKHKQIKEWKKQKKLKKKQKLETNAAKTEDEANKPVETEPMDTSMANITDQSIVGSVDESTGRQWTVSIAVPSSIVDNAQSPELKAYLCGQIARALVIFNIDEIIVFDEYSKQTTIE